MPSSDVSPLPLPHCRNCGTELANSLLACPACNTLVHAVRLKELAAAAEQAATPTESLVHWRDAYELLPGGSRQQQAITLKIDELVRLQDNPRTGKTRSPASKVAAGAGAFSVFLAKFKFIILFVLTKLKLLALGLTKMSTLFSMLLSFSFYWNIWGWKFAAGFILSIYVHEMGHVAMLNRLGIKASAPMFIPGFGAVVRLRQHLPTAREDARVGLAGPIWGLGAAITAWLLGIGLDLPLAIVIAKVGAWINLFNLTPIWQLDGSRAFRALNRSQRILAVSAVVAAFLLAAPDVHGILVIIFLLGLYRLFEKPTEPCGDRRALVEYILLIAAHSALASLPGSIH